RKKDKSGNSQEVVWCQQRIEFRIDRDKEDEPDQSCSGQCLQMHCTEDRTDGLDLLLRTFPGHHRLMAAILPKKLKEIDDKKNELQLTHDSHGDTCLNQDDPLKKEHRKSQQPRKLKCSRRRLFS